MANTSLYGFLWLLLAPLFGQVPYYGPSSPESNRVQVQVLVYDQPELGAPKIESVTFNGTNLKLQPPDLYGFRGGGGFQLQPGSYRLEWRVSRDKVVWPRTLSFSKTIEIQPRDAWVQVTVKGDQASVL